MGVNWTNGPVLQDTGGEEKSSGIFNIYCVFLNVQTEGNGGVIYGASAYIIYLQFKITFYSSKIE